MKVLIAVEDQETGLDLADMVVAHHWPASTEFRLVHVHEPIYLGSVLLTPESAELIGDSIADEETNSLMTMSVIGHKIRQGIPGAKVTKEVISDRSAASHIIRVAQEWEADLIVVGTHGRQGIDRFILGTVSDRILSHAPCSVLLLKPGQVQQLRATA